VDEILGAWRRLRETKKGTTKGFIGIWEGVCQGKETSDFICFFIVMKFLLFLEL
jgi:hypothetical protein